MSAILELPTLDDMLRDVLAAAAPVVAVFGTRIYAAGISPPNSAIPTLLYFPQFTADDECLPSGREGLTARYYVATDAPIGQYQAAMATGMAAVTAALDALRDTPYSAGGYELVTLSSGEAMRTDDPLPGGTVSRRLGRSWLFSLTPS
jgi:hypothetical protein